MTAPLGEDLFLGQSLPPRRVTIGADHIVAGAFASRDWRPQHHDHGACVADYGLPDIIMNTPTQAGWIAAYVTAWTGPRGRIGRIGFQMRRPITPATSLTFRGTIAAIAEQDGCHWARIAVDLSDDDSTIRTASRVLVALPGRDGPEPWRLRGAAFRLPSWDLSSAPAMEVP